MPTDITALSAAAEVVRGHHSFGLIAHQNPDGDALGSALAMYQLLEKQGKRVFVTWPEPFRGAWTGFNFLPEIDKATPPSELPDDLDVIMTFDCASIERTGELQKRLELAKQVVVVDHHLSNPGFGSVNLIDTDAAATTVVLFQLMKVLGWPMTTEIATCLYTGLVTDTGRFQYSNTSVDEFQMAADLLRFDVPIADLSRRLFSESKFAGLKLTAECIERAELDNELRFVHSYVTQEDLDRHGLRREEIDGLVEVLRRTKEAEVSCLLKVWDGETHGSLRAISVVDVSEIAKTFGGGGHRLAAGFSSSLSREEVLASLKAQLSKSNG